MMKKPVWILIVIPMFFVFLVLAGIQITGCGAGGGDSSVSMTPEELEVATAVESFVAAVKAENIDNVKLFLDSNLKYYRVGALTLDNLKFVEYLNGFFTGATVVDFRIDSLGVTVNSESFAEARGQLELSYRDGSDVFKSQSESIKMAFEKTGGVWGMIEFGRYDANDPGSSFPPSL